MMTFRKGSAKRFLFFRRTPTIAGGGPPIRERGLLGSNGGTRIRERGLSSTDGVKSLREQYDVAAVNYETLYKLI